MKAGCGVATITPSVPVDLAGFGARTEPAASVHEDLEARVLYLDDADTALCLVVCDLLGMTPDNAAAVRDAVAGALGLERPNVVVACTHTHSGPSLITGSDALGWRTPDGYLDLVRTRCVEAAISARDTAIETTVRYARPALPDGFSFNRRRGDYDDPRFAVLVADDVGVVANIGIHPVSLGPDWLAVSPDWVGPFRAALEQRTSIRAIELTAALGDINPMPPSGDPEDSYAPWATAEQAADYGARLAGVVSAAVADAAPVVGGLAVVRNDTIEAPVGGTALAALGSQSSMHVELTEWSIGDVALVTIPGEAFHALGRDIAAARNDRVLLAGLAPWQGYLPYPWGEGYEEGVSYGRDFVDAVARALVDA